MTYPLGGLLPLAVMWLLVRATDDNIKYGLSWTPDRVAANDVIVVNLSVDDYSDHFTSMELVLVVNDTHTVLFKATEDDCETMDNRFLVVKLVSCRPTRAEVRLHDFSFTFASLFVRAVDQNPEKSENKAINLYKPPIGLIVKTLHSIPLKLGDDIRLRCYFKGGRHNIGQISWHRFNSSAPVPGTTSVYNYHSEVSWPAKITDQGKYQCKAIYDPATVGIFTSAIIELDILYSPMRASNVPFRSLVKSPFGQNVSLEANIIANPPVHKYWWEKDGGRLSTKSKYKFTGICKLDFVVAPNDYGLYSCVALNAVGKGEVHITLNHAADPPVNEWRPWMSMFVAICIILLLAAVIVILSLAYRVCVLNEELNGSCTGPCCARLRLARWN